MNWTCSKQNFISIQRRITMITKYVHMLYLILASMLLKSLYFFYYITTITRNEHCPFKCESFYRKP